MNNPIKKIERRTDIQTPGHIISGSRCLGGVTSTPVSSCSQNQYVKSGRSIGMKQVRQVVFVN